MTSGTYPVGMNGGLLRRGLVRQALLVVHLDERGVNEEAQDEADDGQQAVLPSKGLQELLQDDGQGGHDEHIRWLEEPNHETSVEDGGHDHGVQDERNAQDRVEHDRRAEDNRLGNIENRGHDARLADGAALLGLGAQEMDGQRQGVTRTAAACSGAEQENGIEHGVGARGDQLGVHAVRLHHDRHDDHIGDHGAVDADAPEKHGYEHDDDHAGTGNKCVERDGQDAHDRRRDVRAHDVLQQRVETEPKHDIGEQRNERGKGVGEERRHGIGHLEGDVMVLEELDDTHDQDRHDHGGEHAAAAQEGGVEHALGGAVGERDLLDGSAHHHEQKHGHEAVCNLALHLQVLGVAIGDAERRGKAHDAHRHVVGQLKPLVDGVGGLQDAGDVEQHRDDGEHRAGEDEVHRAHHAAADGAEYLVGLHLAAELLEHLDRLRFKQLVEIHDVRLLSLDEPIDELEDVRAVADTVICGRNDGDGDRVDGLLDIRLLIGDLRPHEDAIGALALDGSVAHARRRDLELDALLGGVLLQLLHENAGGHAGSANQ